MKKFILVLSALLSASIFISCASVTEVPEDKTSAQIIQMGQNAYSAYDYKSALNCYQTALERFGTNPSIYAEATYEIGHTYLALKKYDKAYETFTSLLEVYDYNASVLPPSYKKLAKIGLSRIPEKKLALLEAKQAEESDEQ